MDSRPEALYNLGNVLPSTTVCIHDRLMPFCSYFFYLLVKRVHF